MEPLFRNLRADEIECRVAQVSEKNGECKGVSLLLYKDARCDMAILDETFGASRWQRKHYECKGNLFCSVGILFNDWVWKDDCGAESNTEKEKGEASDSFKRACFNWGIGRELYTAPFIWIPAKDGFFSAERDKKTNKFKTFDKFIVDKIDIQEVGGKKQICSLVIKNEKSGIVVFRWTSKQKTIQPDGEEEIERVEEKHINALVSLLKQKGVKESAILKRYNIHRFDDMSIVDFMSCVDGLNKMPNKGMILLEEAMDKELNYG